MKVVAFLPVNETIASKLLNAKPLFLYTLEKLCSYDFIDEIYLGSESSELLSSFSHLRYKPFKFDTLLHDENILINNLISIAKADIYVKTSCSFPFIKKKTIKQGLDVLLKNDNYDSVIAKYRNDKIGLFITKHDAIAKMKSCIGEKQYLFEVDPIEAINTNFSPEFEVAEQIAEGIQSKEQNYFRALKYFFNSAIFSDILTDMKLNNVITGLILNLQNKKIFGRANTLKIRALREGESYKGIYEALNTYEKIRRGEIIVVENDFDNRAYFGELNTNLAIRAGAAGTILSGKTRDIEIVNKLDYPVFSTGYAALDVRGVGTFDSQNKPIIIKNVKITPGDLIFADINGICVIPRNYEEVIISMAKESVKKEKKVLDEILDQKNAYDIYKHTGEF